MSEPDLNWSACASWQRRYIKGQAHLADCCTRNLEAGFSLASIQTKTRRQGWSGRSGRGMPGKRDSRRCWRSTASSVWRSWKQHCKPISEMMQIRCLASKSLDRSSLYPFWLHEGPFLGTVVAFPFAMANDRFTHVLQTTRFHEPSWS